MKNEINNNLVKALINYALNNNWCDNEIVYALIDLGFTEQDFLNTKNQILIKIYYEEIK